MRNRPVTWMHLVTFAIVTGVCTVLAIFAVIAAPVPPAPGVSGLYIAAAVYVPVALWFGTWGALAGYVSCVLLGLYTGMPILFVLWWSLADFVEGLLPLAAFRLFNVGGAVFLDTGRTWGPTLGGQPSLGWLSNVGVGLRLGNSRSGLGSVIHVDFTYALDPVPGEDRFQVFVETKQGF